jgi:hypothetical protein
MTIKLKSGDRVAFSAAHVKNTRMSYDKAQRRGTFMAPEGDGNLCRVRWDDEAAMLASGEGYFSQPDYCDDVRANGSLVNMGVICHVKSAKFADTFA